MTQNALGRSKGGFSTKIHALTDTEGRPLHLALTPGNRNEAIVADELLEHAHGRAIVGDSAYDSDRYRKHIRTKGMFPVIASNPFRLRKLPKRRALYSKRYKIECFFHRLKRFRAIASRYEKTAASFLSLLHLAAAFMWLPKN